MRPEEWKGKTAVYTAVIGDFEHLGDHNYEDGVDYHFFTNGEQHALNPRWQEQDLSLFNHVHPRRVSKLPKHHPHFFDVLNKYEYLIWIDGDMQIAHDNFVESYLDIFDPSQGMLLSPHFDGRDDAYGEATIRPPKYQSEPMDEQVTYYRKAGYPGSNGLYETGVIARNMLHPQARELGMRWYIHNMVLSYQDQVSLPFCLWQMNYQPQVLPQSFREYRWVHINAHKHEDPVKLINGNWEPQRG